MDYLSNIKKNDIKNEIITSSKKQIIRKNIHIIISKSYIPIAGRGLFICHSNNRIIRK